MKNLTNYPRIKEEAKAEPVAVNLDANDVLEGKPKAEDLPYRPFEVAYARTVLLRRVISARTQEEAEEVAIGLEAHGRLGLLVDGATLTVKRHSALFTIVDDDTVWEVKAI